MNKTLPILALLFVFQLSLAQNCMNLDRQLQGYFYAGTSQEDTLSPGGYASSQNTPKQITKKINRRSQKETFQIVAQPNSETTFQYDHKGFHVLVINKTDTIVGLSAQDGRIDIIRQVYYDGSWQAIEFLQSSWCGNSYHNVYINPNQYWEFAAPCMEGDTKSKFRFALAVDKDITIYSNEFSGSFNLKQLEKEKGHLRDSLMDPLEN